MQGFINTLLSADADSVCGAAYGARDAGRSNRRNGYRHRDLDTRVGTLDVAVPKLREGSYFPDWLLLGEVFVQELGRVDTGTSGHRSALSSSGL